MPERNGNRESLEKRTIMLFIAEFGMHADKPDVFKAALEPHLEYLRNQKDSVLISATKSDPISKKNMGFVWIIRAQDALEADAICKRDPFWIAGLRTSFCLSILTKALPDYIAEI